jgi:hypothetical protein
MRAFFGGGSYGIYNPASRAGGGLSLHAEGRAADHSVPVTTDGKRLGDRIFDWLVAHADAIGLQEVQFHGRIWTSRRASEGVRRDTAAATIAHRDHVHWGVCWRTARDPDLGRFVWDEPTEPAPAPPAPPTRRPSMILMQPGRHAPGHPELEGYAVLDPQNQRILAYNGASFGGDAPVTYHGVAFREYRFDGKDGRPNAVGGVQDWAGWYDHDGVLVGAMVTTWSGAIYRVAFS